MEHLVTLQRQQERLYDPLTGLAGAGLFYDRVQRSLASPDSHEGTMGMLLIRTFMTDEERQRCSTDDTRILLGDVGRRIEHEMHDQESAGRLAFDAFGMLMVDGDRHALNQRARSLLVSVESPVQLSFGELTPRVLIGGSVAHPQIRSASDLFAWAHRALMTAEYQHEGFHVLGPESEHAQPA